MAFPLAMDSYSNELFGMDILQTFSCEAIQLQLDPSTLLPEFMNRVMREAGGHQNVTVDVISKVSSEYCHDLWVQWDTNSDDQNLREFAFNKIQAELAVSLYSPPIAIEALTKVLSRLWKTFLTGCYNYPRDRRILHSQYSHRQWLWMPFIRPAALVTAALPFHICSQHLLMVKLSISVKIRNYFRARSLTIQPPQDRCRVLLHHTARNATRRRCLKSIRQRHISGSANSSNCGLMRTGTLRNTRLCCLSTNTRGTLRRYS